MHDGKAGAGEAAGHSSRAIGQLSVRTDWLWPPGGQQQRLVGEDGPGLGHQVEAAPYFDLVPFVKLC